EAALPRETRCAGHKALPHPPDLAGGFSLTDRHAHAQLAGPHRRLGPTARAELAQDRRDVHARGLVADKEPFADLPVGEALGHELEYLSLPEGQLDDLRLSAPAHRLQARTLGELRGEAAGPSQPVPAREIA